ncbi:MAG: hypothetical protein OXF01_19220 [Gemmatimonadetes bacterium]|nr:hypothetical protein [Gemmatimonadota bacterium]
MPLSLQSARNDEEVVEAVSRAAWHKCGLDGDPEIPALNELADWWRLECPREIRLQAEGRTSKLIDFCVHRDGKPPKQFLLFETTEPELPTLLDRGQPYDITQRWLYARESGFDGRHPLGGVLVAWYTRRVPVPANTRNDSVFPRIGATRQEEKAVALAVSQGQVGQMLTLPGFGPGEPDGPPNPTPAYPLMLWEMASRALSHERNKHAAWLAARIFVDVILDVAPEHWPLSASHGVRLPAQRFRDFLARIYTPGRSGRIHWSRTKQLDTMLEAFDLLEAREMRIPWTDSEKQVGGLRRVLVPLDVPRSGHADDVVQFAIHLPPGITEGPLLDRIFLRLAGAKSMPAWRLWLNLSDLWRIPGRTRVPVGRTWFQVKAAGRYPVVSDAELLAWAFPTPEGATLNRSTQRTRLSRARKALEWMIEQGAVSDVSSSEGRRLMPGPNWAGWRGGRK